MELDLSRGRFSDVLEKRAKYAVFIASGMAQASGSVMLRGTLKAMRSSAMQYVLFTSERLKNEVSHGPHEYAPRPLTSPVITQVSKDDLTAS